MSSIPISITLPTSSISSSAPSLVHSNAPASTDPVSSSTLSPASPVFSAPTPVSVPSISSSPPVLHPMITRSKHGIFKPNIPFSLSLIVSPSAPSDPTEPTEPTNFSEAISHPEWQKAMAP